MKLCFTVVGQTQDALTCDNAHSWRVYSAASLRYQAAGTMTCYPTQSYYPDIEPNSSCPIIIMLSARLGSDIINLKIIGLTQPGLENTRCRFEPATFRFPDRPEREADTLLIGQPNWLFHLIAFIVSIF